MPVYRRPDRKRNPWYFKFMLNGDLKREYGFRTQKEAQDAEAALRQMLLRFQTHTAFLTAVTKRLDYLKAYSTPGHYRDNRTLLARFAEWKELLLIEITREMVQNRLIELAQKKGNPNANKTLRALKSVFEMSIEEIGRNPCRGIKMFPVEKPVIFVPSKEQISKVLLLATPGDQAYLSLIWQTGGRVREVNNLPWEDVDWEKRQVRLWTRKKRGGNRTPRWVPLTEIAYNCLRYAWKNRDKNSPWVFTNPRNGRRYDYRDKFFHSLCRQAGVPEMGYHALRHRRASELAEGGASLAHIRDFLGHENAVTTSNYLKALGYNF